jgi:hypothetical protein
MRNVMSLLSKHYRVFVLDPRNQVLSQRVDFGTRISAGAPANNLIVDMSAVERAMATNSPHFVNSESFAREFIKNNPEYQAKVLFDHAVNDWRDVVRHKIKVTRSKFPRRSSPANTATTCRVSEG